MQVRTIYPGLFLVAAAFVLRRPSSGSREHLNRQRETGGPLCPEQCNIREKKPKKVCTNDELSSVSGGVSVVGDGNQATAQPSPRRPESSTGGNDFRRKQIETYRNQIQQLQSQIDVADKRITQLKNFKGEHASPAGGINPAQGYNMVPVEEQVRQLEEKKKHLQAKIDDLQIDARKNGIDPGELRQLKRVGCSSAYPSNREPSGLAQGQEQGQIALEILRDQEIFLHVLMTMLPETRGNFRMGQQKADLIGRSFHGMR